VSSLYRRGNIVPVIIGRHGDIIAASDVDARSVSVGQRVSVEVVGRHRLWEDFRQDIFDFAQHGNMDGLVYAPLTHIDLTDIPFWNGSERFDAIAKHMSPENKTVLDIGANLGYMCEQLEATGRQCTAVEVSRRHYYILTKLKRAQSFSYEAVNEDIFSYIERNRRFDAVLSLAIFHHFLKTKESHDRLVTLLNRLETREMFFWAHNPEEKQMRDSYRNYAPNEFAALITEHSCLSHFRVIGIFNDRTLYHLQ
jgi:2-polyprenyl-3-methyl-5-hydroxy-6-metoxy-1,4-benzoquinol methylase